MNRRFIFPAVALLLLALVVLWFGLFRTMRSTGGMLPANPEPVRANDQALPVPHESPQPRQAPASPTVATASTPTNAADIYATAFFLLDVLSKEEKLAVSDWKTNLDPAVAAELCGKIDPIVALAHDAAALTNCEWNTNNGMGGTDPTLAIANHARDLARAIAWHAAHCQQNDSAGLGDDLEAAVRAGQNMPHNLLCHLVNTAIQGIAADFLAAHAGVLTGDVAARLAKLFRDGQYEESFYRALEGEADFVSENADEFIPSTSQQFDGNGHVPPMSHDQAVEAVQQAAELDREYAQVLSMPDAEYQARLDMLHASQQTNPFIKSIWPGLDNALDRTRAMVVQRTMVSTALALIQNEPNALQNHPDPASGGSFAYSETADGFELQSAYQRNGKPIVMTFRTH